MKILVNSIVRHKYDPDKIKGRVSHSYYYHQNAQLKEIQSLAVEWEQPRTNYFLNGLHEWADSLVVLAPPKEVGHLGF